MSTICWTMENEDGLETVHQLPAEWAICDRCRGNGTHDHPAFNGFTGSEWAEACYDNPDWPEEYARGVYSVPCEECGGSGKVLEVDRECCDPALLSAYEEQQSLDARWAAEDRRTRWAEGGYRG